MCVLSLFNHNNGTGRYSHPQLWIRLGKYPGITFGSVLGSDGVGVFLSQDYTMPHRISEASTQG